DEAIHVVAPLRPGVDQHANARGDDVGGVGLHLELAHGGGKVGLASGQRLAKLLDAKGDPGGGGQRVLARGHGSGAGMIRPALDEDFEARDTGNGSYDTDVELLVLKHRALLDMEFEEG